MSSAEFDIIGRYFNNSGRHDLPDEDIVLDNGDDCAVLSVPADKQLVVTVDTLISGVPDEGATVSHELVESGPERINIRPMIQAVHVTSDLLG